MKVYHFFEFLSAITISATKANGRISLKRQILGSTEEVP